MSGFLFLAAVVVVSAIGSFVLWLRLREPRAWDWQIREFQRTLEALSPEAPMPGRDRDGERAELRSRERGAE